MSIGKRQLYWQCDWHECSDSDSDGLDVNAMQCDATLYRRINHTAGSMENLDNA